MMKHLNDETLLTFADGELDDVAGDGVQQHLAICDECSTAFAEVRELRGLLARVVQTVDAAEPAAWRRARFRPGLAPRPAPRRTAPPAWRWAAGIVLVTAAAGSAAVIAFPELLRDTAGQTAAPAAAPPTVVESRALAAARGAVHVAMVDGRVDIELSGVAPGTQLRVELVAGSDAGIEVAGAETTRFQARDGRIDADLGGRVATVTVTLPRDVRSAVISANGSVAVRATDGQVTPSEAAAGGVTLDR
jgi:anti-sigma factor ChrR (cupin superfamily)